jgi:hypothetical protein
LPAATAATTLPRCVFHALDVRAAIALELRFDPCDGVAIALRAFTAIAELRQSFDRRLVFLKVEVADDRRDIVGWRRWLCGRLRRRLLSGAARLPGGLRAEHASHQHADCSANHDSRPHGALRSWQSTTATGRRMP